MLGLVAGLAADRLAARWPAHDAGPLRRPDWRTAVMGLAGAAALGAIPLRWSEPRDIAVLVVFFLALIVLLATDLDQRLLPDVITLSLVPVALVVLLLGADPLLRAKDLGVASGFIAGVAVPVLLAISSAVLRGGIGMGDVKLSVSLGLMAGLSRLFVGLLIASALSSVVLVLLLATRRLTLRSYIPFGPVIIAGAIVAALLP